MPPAAIAAVLIVLVVVLGYFGYRSYNSGPKVEGVESMPPEVRKAYSGHGTTPTPQNP